MAAHIIQTISVEDLLINQFNPRHVSQPSQRDAIATIAHDQGVKLLNLAEDIVDKGLNPSELPMVTSADQAGFFVLLEGNRRIVALKLLSSPQLLNSIGLSRNLEQRYRNLAARAGADLPLELQCAVLSREDANHWIQLKHTGENAGVGIVPWDGRARQRFRGSSPALQAIDIIEKSDLIDNETKQQLEKISITNVERVLSTPDARVALGVDVKGGQLILVAPESEAMGRLAILIDDIATKRVKVTDLDTRDQRVQYAREIAGRPLPNPGATGAKPAAGGTGAKTGTGATRKVSPNRKTLIPQSLKLSIQQPRINRIYHELQKLSAEEYVNSCAVMFRVFIELSIDHYAQVKTISLKVTPKTRLGVTTQKPLDMTLREKIKTVTGYMENHGVASKAELQGIRSLYANREHVLSVDSLNAYIHNKDYSPTPTDLKANWDSIQVFVQYLWTI